jgi:hypothetical protein
VSDRCLSPSEQYFNHITTRTSYIRWDNDVVNIVLDQHDEVSIVLDQHDEVSIVLDQHDEVSIVLDQHA